ncbi:MAG: NADH-quinone oxidoreductase subunit N [Calditrichota bacterium]
MSFNSNDLTVVAPELVTLALAVLVLLAELVITRQGAVLQAITVIGLALVMAVAILTGIQPEGAFNGMISGGGFSLFIKILLVGVALLTALMGGDYFRSTGVRQGEFYSLLLLCTVGMMALATAADLVVLFIGLETMSIALYALTGIRSERARSSEAALKYLLLGAFATGFLLYGIALIYGASGGKTQFAAIEEALSAYSATNPAPVTLYAGIGLLMIGFLFKVAAVPFHFWSPDVYQGAPTPVTAFMSAGPKAAALIAFLRLFGWTFPNLAPAWGPILGVIAAATMIVANIIALAQSDLKRMLAYSSVAHAGYLLLGVLVAGNPAVRQAAAAGMLFYLTGYYLMNIGAFTIAILISRAQGERGDYQIDDYQGLASRHPGLALAMTLFMVSLAGIPPTAGFFGKFYLFSAAVAAGHITLVVIAVLMSVVSAFYYLRLVVFMYMKPAVSTYKVITAPALATVIIICVAGVIYFGIMPGGLMQWAEAGSRMLILPTAY